MAGDRDRIERLRETARSRWEDADDAAVGPALASDDAEVRAGAAWALAELAADDPDRARDLVVPSKLAPLLDDEDQWVRRGASWAFATVAEDHPDRCRTALSELTEALVDEDPLVRENSVIAVAGIAVEHPRTVEPALSRLSELAERDDLAGRYAAETFRRLVARLDQNGFPETIEASADVADLLPDDADVVATTGEDSEESRVRVGSGSATPDRTVDRSSPEPDEDVAVPGPPDRVTAPPAIAVDRGEFQRLADLGGDPLTTTVKARAPSTDEGGQHVVVSVRTLRRDVDADPDRVETAFRAWAGVDDHDHVRTVLAHGTTPRPWIATEFADGGTLRNAAGGIGFARALWYARCIARTLSHAHARGVVHGGLRPGVVGLSSSLGAWPVPKVGDWDLGDSLATVEGLPVPPAFAAPEHFEPDRFGRPDHATDVYQLGAVCYAMFAGRPPFVGETAEIATAVRTEEPAPPSEMAPDLPSGVDDLVGRALTKSKPARFETAEDFVRALELLVDEHVPVDE